jgi:aspartokinase/homoserine dehydrogenase 1
VANCYPKWLAEGIHVIATNKRGVGGPGKLYDQAKQAALSSKTQWLYETTAPGSGLPLLATLKDMTQSGDVVSTVSGRFSASVSFIFSQVIEGVPLSKALAAACEKGLCEPDPRDDLNGVDNARSLVVLARDLGIELELSDVECESLLPAELKKWKPAAGTPLVEQLCKALEPYDASTAERVNAMIADGFVPVQLSKVDVATGKVRLSVRLRVRLRVRVRVRLS